MKLFFTLAAAAASAQAYWLMGIEDFITTERIDPIVNPGKVSGHVHSVLGGSNFRLSTNTSFLRQSECSSIPIPQDKSNYWFPHLYFQWKNGSFTSLDGGAVMYYLFSDTPGTTTAFPDDFRMLSGDPTLRTYDPNSHAQQAITFLCLDFNGVSTKHNELPSTSCPSGIRAQINFPSCWDGKNLDSPDHKSHVAFLSNGPDSGTCSDPNFPVVLPRIFIEVYWSSNSFDSVRSQAMNSTQPFVYSYGDPTGYGYHADFINGWDAGVLQRAVDNCHCNPYGDPTCCVNQGLFNMNQGKNCRITKAIDEQTTGTLLKLPGNNPVQPFGTKATMFAAGSTPALLSPIYAYTGDSPSATGSVVVPGQTNASGSSSVATTPAGTPTLIVNPPTTAPASSSTQTTVTPTTVKTTPTTTSVHTSSPIFSIPTISIPTIPTLSIPFPSVSLPHVLAPSHGATTPAVAVPATQPTSVAAPANGGSPASSKPANSSSGKTCSGKKKRRAMEAHHRRRNFEAHVRHLDYVYTN
ncbi:hypothetical protein BDN70DRAFT_879454 [Pholiota conissans]|uniref:DUF1996 domain-containing protein n=1 Tax=Pholiota conissans TaxID=109636 RepID=A0A9P5YZZ4_9AGAR|nr:hypothetical protein BDN70DRAFT_879454 [Pholiota conissans]